MKTALFPGSFDPFTNGHLDVVRRGLGLFDRVLVALGNNSSKQRYLPLEQMLAILTQLFAAEPRVEVVAYQGLTANFARERGAGFILRGLRNTLDFEYETPIAQANAHLHPGLETVFLPPAPSLAGLSSTIIRDIHRFGGDVAAFLPYELDIA